MNRYKCEVCCKESIGKRSFCHGQMMTDMGEWALESKPITHAPMIGKAATYQYQCPITGREINGKRDHEENLARHGCRVLEDGEHQDAARRRQHEAAKLDQSLDEGVTKIIDQMGHDKREQLVKEVTGQV